MTVYTKSENLGIFKSEEKTYFDKLADDYAIRIYRDINNLAISKKEKSLSAIPFHIAKILKVYIGYSKKLGRAYLPSQYSDFVPTIVNLSGNERQNVIMTLSRLYTDYRKGQVSQDLYNPSQSSIELDPDSWIEKAAKKSPGVVESGFNKLLSGAVIIGVAYVGFLSLPGILTATAQRKSLRK